MAVASGLFSLSHCLFLFVQAARDEIEAEWSAHANAVETLDRPDSKLYCTFLAPSCTMLRKSHVFKIVPNQTCIVYFARSLACSLVYFSRSHEQQVLVETRQAPCLRISVPKLETATRIFPE